MTRRTYEADTEHIETADDLDDLIRLSKAPHSFVRELQNGFLSLFFVM